MASDMRKRGQTYSKDCAPYLDLFARGATAGISVATAIMTLVAFTIDPVISNPATTDSGP